MQARCRKSLVWIGPLVLLVLAGWGGTGSTAARAADDLDLSWMQDAVCADGAAVAALDLPEWLTEPAESSPEADKICINNNQCKGKTYCAKAPGECKGRGKCTNRPDTCTEELKPVCGCDGKTYPNACEAAAAGVNVNHEGACRTGSYGKPCRINKQCPKGDFCAKDTGKCDEEGMCAVRPKRCTLIFAPVCGCDNKTYSNACVAHGAGVNVKHDGKCEK